MKAHRLFLAAAAAVAAAVPAPAQPPAAAPSELGSPQRAATTFSSDYRALVAAALPKIEAEELAQYVTRAQAEATDAKALTVRDTRSWAALFELEVGTRESGRPAEIIDLESASYLVDPEAGRFYVAIDVPNAAPVPRQEFAQVLPEIRRAHEALAERIGIPRSEIFFLDFRETLAQSTPAPRLAGAQESPIESVGATTTLLRSVGGLLVDGSFVSISSVDARRFEVVDVRWPKIRLFPEVEARRILAPSRLTERIVQRISASARGEEVNVLMAVVLRPVEANHRIYFVPSLRVGVAPKSKPEKDGYLTEAGEEFYLDLIAGMEDLPELDDRDLVPESLERKQEPRRPAAKATEGNTSS